MPELATALDLEARTARDRLEFGFMEMNVDEHGAVIRLGPEISRRHDG